MHITYKTYKPHKLSQCSEFDKRINRLADKEYSRYETHVLDKFLLGGEVGVRRYMEYDSGIIHYGTRYDYPFNSSCFANELLGKNPLFRR